MYTFIYKTSQKSLFIISSDHLRERGRFRVEQSFQVSSATLKTSLFSLLPW